MEKKPTKTTVGDTLHFVEELKRQWVATFDALIDPIMIIGPDHVVQRANLAAAKMSGLDVRKVVGMKCHKALAGRGKPCPGCKLLDTLAENAPHQFPLQDVVADRVFEVTSQIFPGSEKQKAAVHIYRDRTEAALMQERLIQNEKLASIGLLAGGIAHEINNPLGGIMIFSQMLLREMSKESPHYSDVIEIETAAQRCKQIVENLLDFARMQPADEQGKVRKRNFTSVDALEATASALRFARINLKQKQNIHIIEHLSPAGDAPSTSHQVHGDKNQIIQVVLNLLQNAIHAMPRGGDLSLRVCNDASEKNVLILVADTGKGIKPEHLKKIFDPFFTTKEPGEGTGLGLSICYGLVTGMGGELSVASTPEQGTTFTVSLPLLKAQQEP